MEEFFHLGIYAICPSNLLTLPKLQVWSYLAYQSSYGDRSTFRKISQATGLNKDTVPKIVGELIELGLVGADGLAAIPEDKSDWFVFLSSDRSRHFSRRMAYWKSFVRAPGSPLSNAAICSYSYMLEKTRQNYQPKRGWTKTYLATCLRIDPETVGRAFDSLESHGLIQFMEDGSLGVRSKLTPQQSELFLKRGQKESDNKASGFTVRLLDDVADTPIPEATKESPKPEPSEKKPFFAKCGWPLQEFQALKQFLNVRCELKDEDLKDAVRNILEQPTGLRTWRQAANDAYKLGCDSPSELYGEFLRLRLERALPMIESEYETLAL